ncbi:hypothetical protein [Aurantiacibacter suaedae]|uniref:hypothetical protein n=1 Tax=Aurantiacibacter suaedae TaxID=2545755 RepID=UPI0010F4AD38|nr:hypothetical protein [Aurantiacibacter suaedae]
MLEPLHPKLWRRRLHAIVTALTIVRDIDDSACLRRLYHLLALTPEPLRQWFAPSLSEDMFEQVLLQSCRTAALSLIGKAFDLALTVDRHGEGVAVTLRLGEADVEVAAQGSSLARAVVRGICEIGLKVSDS